MKELDIMTAASKNILTYQQINADKKEYMQPTMKEVCKYFKKLKEQDNNKNVTYCFYHMNNVKITYMYTPASQCGR